MRERTSAGGLAEARYEVEKQNVHFPTVGGWIERRARLSATPGLKKGIRGLLLAHLILGISAVVLYSSNVANTSTHKISTFVFRV